jgi:hypothetical protein
MFQELACHFHSSCNLIRAFQFIILLLDRMAGSEDEMKKCANVTAPNITHTHTHARAHERHTLMRARATRTLHHQTTAGQCACAQTMLYVVAADRRQTGLRWADTRGFFGGESDKWRQPARLHPLFFVWQDAYEPTLGKVHNFVVKKMFQAGVNMVPARKDFILKLGPDEACHIRLRLYARCCLCVVGLTGEDRHWLSFVGM